MEGSSMDDVVNRLARELADAIAAAVAENPQVEACREKARAAGFEMKVTLEAVVGFVSRSQSTAMTKVTAPVRAGRSANSGNSGAAGSAGNAGNDVQPRRNFDVTANDRRFLRSLRIAADETTEPVE
jgi:carbon monoxide dehydrogenase subunit G